uniref:Retinoic acid receptor responder protein 2 n=1 Tax=Neogobius melanostomus TaxID=47308 RepID=A0A8C6U8J0_9GOBI
MSHLQERLVLEAKGCVCLYSLGFIPHPFERKMATVAQLLLFSALLYVAAAQNPYNDLPVGYRRGVDLALEQLNSSTAVPHHYRLFWTVEKTESNSGQGLKYLYHHFHLKPTRCAKGTTGTNAQRCPFRNDRPLMDCVTCYKTSSDQIEQILNHM